MPTASKLSAVKLDGNSIQLDGVANERVWQSAAYVTGMTSYDPLEGEAPAAEADVRFFYDDVALYVYARIYEPKGSVRGRYAAREKRGSDDFFEIMLDTFHDRRTGYDFCVTPYGVQLDYTIIDDQWSSAWDGVWDSATEVYADGYAIEVRLPFRTLRFPKVAQMKWGIGFGVYTGASKQFDKWPAISSNQGTLYAQLAELDGLEGISPGHNADIIPSLVLSHAGRADDGAAPGAPRQSFAWNRAVPLRLRDPGIVDPGLDVRYGITSATQATLTLNPDFSQVEADPDQLTYNLRFPVLLAEKRPFFLEGIDTFGSRVEAVGAPIPPPVPLLYTRTIIDPVAGVKMTGREGGVAFGLLSAWDQLPVDSLVTPLPRAFKRAPRPSAFDAVAGSDALTTAARISVDVGAGSRVGAFAANKTLVDRTTHQVQRNDVVSADTFLTFDEIYSVTAQVAGSKTARPAGNAFSGQLYDFTLKRKDPHLLLEGRTSYYSQGFRAEMSPITRVNHRPSALTASYRFYTGLEAVSFIEPGVTANTAHEATSGDLLDWSAVPSLTTRLGANTDVKVAYSHGQETYVRAFTPLRVVSASVATNPLPWLEAEAEFQTGDQIHYQIDDLYRGRLVQGIGTLIFQAFHRAELHLRYAKSLLWDPSSALRENVDLYYAKLNFSINQRLSLRGIGQLDTFSQTFLGSLLAAYQVYPGTEAFLGYLENDAVSDGYQLSPYERRIFLKLSYRLQL